MRKHEPLYDFESHSRSFLNRAKAHLARFDADGDVESFFAAALYLRFGIEARVTEYLKVALERKGKRIEDVDEFAASILLKHLARTDPTAPHASRITIRRDDEDRATALAYTPVRPALARLHGQLGGLLHYRFFVQNKYWYLRDSLAAKNASSLTDFRETLSAAMSELEYSVSGTLLGNPEFSRFVDEVMSGTPGPQGAS